MSSFEEANSTAQVELPIHLHDTKQKNLLKENALTILFITGNTVTDALKTIEQMIISKFKDECLNNLDFDSKRKLLPLLQTKNLVNRLKISVMR